MSSKRTIYNFPETYDFIINKLVQWYIFIQISLFSGSPEPVVILETIESYKRNILNGLSPQSFCPIVLLFIIYPK